MTTTRVVYLEPDPCLRGFMSRLMRGCPQLEVVATVGTAEEALALDLSHVDAAVVEQVLGPWSITGWDVALELRRRKRVGVIFFTSHTVPDVGGLLPPDQHQGWSVVHKAMDVEAEYFAQVIQSTARGLNIMDPSSQRRQRAQASGVLGRLTERQRRIMNLASSGRDGKAIAQELGLAPVTVRQELSRIYSLLVPDSAPGYDLRTTAVVRYLRELQGSGTSSEAPIPVSSAG
jgi:two-component system, NarL family, response regulator DesR